MIFDEVQKIRLSRGLKAAPYNLKERVRRSLTNDAKTAELNNSEQSNKLSIANSYPEYSVQTKESISFNEKGLVKSISEVEENSFCLRKI